jgi:hypothetical protein
MNILIPRDTQILSQIALAQQSATRVALAEQAIRASKEEEEEEEDDYIYDEGFTSQVKQYDPSLPILLTLALGGIVMALFSTVKCRI